MLEARILLETATRVKTYIAEAKALSKGIFEAMGEPVREDTPSRSLSNAPEDDETGSRGIPEAVTARRLALCSLLLIQNSPRILTG